MAKSEVVCGLDLGSGRVSCVIARPEAEGQALAAVGGASVPCRGLNGGVVVNIAETARAITRAVEEAEGQAKETVRGVYLGARGAHLQSFNNRGAYNIARTDKEITAEDVQAVIENAKAIPISSDREILHVIPQGYSLDRQRGVPNPVGMEGSLLEVEVHVVTASSSHLNNLFKAVNQAGFEVIEPVYGLLAIGELIVTAEEKELGCLVLDLGGHTISIGIYSEGSLRYSKELPIGTDIITRDIALGLRTSIATAQTIKEKHGVALSSLLNGDDEVAFVGMDGRTPQRVKTRTLIEIVQPRVEELISKIGEEVQNSNYADLIAPTGAIVTGGGALLKGMPEATSEVLNLPVRIGLPHRDTLTVPDALATLPFTTALALVAHSSEGAPIARGWNKKTPRAVRKIWSLFEDVF